MQDKDGQKGRKKVCLMVTKGVWGGAQKYVYNLATRLSKDTYEVFVITGEGEILKNKLEEKGIRVIEIPHLKRDISILDEIKSFVEIFKILNQERPDVLHLNSPKASGIGSFIGRILRIPKIIMTVHGFSWNEDRNIISKILIYFFSWITMLLCHKTIVISKKDKGQAEKLPFIDTNKISLIKNGVESIPFVEKDEARKKLLSDIGKKDAGNVLWLGTIAELHRNKGLEYTINSLTKINKPFVFFIIGEGEERENLEKLITKNGLENRVFLPGFVDGANQYLKAFDIFTLTSIKEGLPYVILEAGIASLPVIATSVGGVPDIIDNGVNGILIKAKSSADLTKSINHLINFVDKQKTFGEKLKAKMENEFSMEKMLQKTESLYK